MDLQKSIAQYSPEFQVKALQYQTIMVRTGRVKITVYLIKVFGVYTATGIIYLPELQMGYFFHPIKERTGSK